MSSDAGQSARPTILLVAGAALGVILAAVGLLGSTHSVAGPMPGDAVARVNGEVIRRDEYQRVLDALAQDKRTPLDDAERRRVLDRLIDEELLVQRGVELGLARHDGKIRKDLTNAVIDSVIAEFNDVAPADQELQSFYDDQRELFAGPGRLHVRQIFCRAPTNADAPMAFERAQQAAQRLRAGEDFEVVRVALGDQELAPLPDSLLPQPKLIDYLGPTAAQTATTLAVGEVSDPVRSSTGYHVLQLIEQQPNTPPPLDEIKPQVLAEYRRRASERALRAYLDDLRRRAQVDFGESIP